MRILIISPHFPPTNGADMHRIRLLLPYFREAGADVEVLAVAPESTNCPIDPWQEVGVPPGIRVHRVKGLAGAWRRVPGLGTVGFRTYLALRRTGNQLLKSGKFDLVYFSTTVFEAFALGAYWRRCIGIPFVLDYQDPWVNDYYKEHLEVIPPGGRIKYWVVDAISRWMEPRTLRHCSGMTSVSAAYPEQLTKRYPWLKLHIQEKEKLEQEKESRNPDLENSFTPHAANHKSVFPADYALPFIIMRFPGDKRDFERVKVEKIRQTAFEPDDGLIHWVYVGVVPPSMHLTLRAFFAALVGYLPDLPLLRLHFIGTSYASAGSGTPSVAPIAAEYGLTDVVEERTDRIPYSETLACLRDADALVILGSDDSGYTASKLFPYLFAEKPLLAIFHENSSVVELMSEVGGGICVQFATGSPLQSIVSKVQHAWFQSQNWQNPISLDHSAFDSHTARRQADQLVAFFKSLLKFEPQ